MCANLLHGPRSLPADPMDGVRMVAEVPVQLIRVSRPAKPSLVYPIAIRHQRKPPKRLRIAANRVRQGSAQDQGLAEHPTEDTRPILRHYDDRVGFRTQGEHRARPAWRSRAVSALRA